MTTIMRPADLAEKINERLLVYSSALAADMHRFRTQFGEGPVREALQLIEQRGKIDADWDAQGHARQVRVGLMRAIAEHHENEAERIAAALPGSWR